MSGMWLIVLLFVLSGCRLLRSDNQSLVCGDVDDPQCSELLDRAVDAFQRDHPGMRLVSVEAIRQTGGGIVVTTCWKPPASDTVTCEGSVAHGS